MWREPGNRASAYSICAGIAPARTVSAKVFFHKSHIKQRHGHSRLVRNNVLTETISPSREHSSSAKNKYGRSGSTRLRGGRSAAIQASRPAASTGTEEDMLTNTAKEIVCGIRPRGRVDARVERPPAKRRVESAVSGTLAF